MYFFKKSIITRDDTGPYLVRWTLFGCRFFSIKIHHILQSDDACVHDHPWFFISLILKGGYFEEAPVGESIVSGYEYLREELMFKHMYLGTEKKWYKLWSILHRPAHYRHRLELPPGKTCWTLVFTGKPFREWGFWTPTGWVKHEQYDPTKQDC